MCSFLVRKICVAVLNACVVIAGAGILLFSGSAVAGIYDGNLFASAGNTTVQNSESVVHILALGDSLTAGYGLEAADSYPAVLEARLNELGWRVKVINAGVSGDTSAGGLARLGWALGAVPGGKPDIVIVALGANDALRGLDPATLRQNLDAIIRQCQAAGARVLLAGMHAPRNMGQEYTRQFDAVYPELATQYGITLYPFLLEGLALNPALNLRDGMHPNAAGVREMVNRLLPVVEREMESL